MCVLYNYGMGSSPIRFQSNSINKYHFIDFEFYIGLENILMSSSMLIRFEISKSDFCRGFYCIYMASKYPAYIICVSWHIGTLWKNILKGRKYCGQEECRL